MQPGTETSRTIKKEWGEGEIVREYSLHDLLKRPGLGYAQVARLKGEPITNEQAAEQVEIQTKYDGLHCPPARRNDQLRRYENTKLPLDLNYDGISGLSNEVKQKLRTLQPGKLWA